jgi:DNA-binding MarR family transcriptional regulator
MTTTRMSTRERSQMATSLRVACMRISRRVRFESGDDLAPHQFSVLLRIEDGARTPRELAEIERVSAPSMTRTVAALVDRGLVLRAEDPNDRRSVLLSLSREGVEMLKAIRRRREAWMLDRIKHMDDGELETLRRATEILERVAAE